MNRYCELYRGGELTLISLEYRIVFCITDNQRAKIYNQLTCETNIHAYRSLFQLKAQQSFNRKGMHLHTADFRLQKRHLFSQQRNIKLLVTSQPQVIFTHWTIAFPWKRNKFTAGIKFKPWIGMTLITRKGNNFSLCFWRRGFKELMRQLAHPNETVGEQLLDVTSISNVPIVFTLDVQLISYHQLVGTEASIPKTALSISCIPCSTAIHTISTILCGNNSTIYVDECGYNVFRHSDELLKVNEITKCVAPVDAKLNTYYLSFACSV